MWNTEKIYFKKQGSPIFKVNGAKITKVIILFQSFCLNLFRSQLEYTDIVPFIFYQQTSLKNYGGPSPKEATIDYSSQNFKAVPQVIVGIIKYDNNYDPNNGISFELASDSITQTSCMVKVSEGIESTLLGITVSVLVIDTSQFPYIKVIHAYKDNLFSGISTFSYEETIQFSSQIQKLSGTKRVEVFLRGWVSESYPLDRFTLQIKIGSISSNDYKIKISSNSQSQKITKVYYTIVEYISDANSIYGLISQQDIQYQSQPNTSCFYNPNCSNSARYFPVNFNVKDILYQSSSQYKFFATINQLDFETRVVGQNPRIQLTNFKFKSSNQLTYDYNVWDGSTCFVSSSSSLFFYSKKCQQSNEKIWGDTCTSTCINFDTSNPSLCLDCLSGQFYLQDKKSCQSNKPDGYSCQSIYQACQNCNISNCLDCELKSNSFVCIKCSSGFYLYNGNCTIIQPDNTYCDINNLVCSQCSDSTCKTCENPSTNPQLCLSCLSNYYFLNGKCSQNQPEGTYCSGYNCQMCSNQACLSCTDPANPSQKCYFCKKNNYFYNDQCSSIQPDNTYCQTSTYNCYQCPDPNCKKCNEPQLQSSQCLSCMNGFYLFEDKCQIFSQIPENLYCDSNSFKCFKCHDQSCQTCTDPRSSSSQCISCKNNLILNQQTNKCQKRKQDIKESDSYYETQSYTTIQQAATLASSVAVVSSTINAANTSQFFLTLQKLNFIIIIQILFQEEINIFLQAIKGANPLETIKKINLFSKYFIKESKDQLIQEITNKLGQTSIVENAGGIIVIILSNLFLMVPQLIIEKYDNQQNFYQYNVKKDLTMKQKMINFYSKFSCNIFYQINEIIIIVSFQAIFLQIAGLQELNTLINLKEIKIIFIIAIIIYQISLLCYYIKVLNSSQKLPIEGKEQNKKFKSILFRLLQSDTIQINLLVKNFKILYILIENVLIPAFITMFYQNFRIQCSVCIVLQAILGLVSILIRPYQLFLDNLKLIVEQICWTISFTFFLVYGILIEKQVDRNEEYQIALNTLTIIIKILIITLLVLNPLIQIIKILLKIPQLVRKVKEWHKVKQEQKIQMQLIELSQNNKNIIIFQQKKSKLFFN